MKTRNIAKIIILTTLLILAIIMGKLSNKISFGADNEEKAILQGSFDKYINYELQDGSKGTLVQYSLRTGIEYENEFFAIRTSEVNVSLNQIDGKYPFDVKVIAKSTKATNGKTSDIVEDYNYDSNTGMLTIRTSNENENGEPIYSEMPGENDKDEYVIISYYDTYTQDKPERDLICNVSYKAILFTDDNREVITQGSLEQKVTEDVGELTSIYTNVSDVYNGYIKSNIINGTTYDTEYTENNEIEISKKEAHQKIYLQEQNTYINLNDIYYKSTKILKNDIIDVLGENGKIEILDGNGNVITTVDNNSEFNENGEYIITYDDDINNISIKTSNVISEGSLHIENVKKIKSDVLNLEDKDINTKISLIGINEKEIEVEGSKNDISTEDNVEKQIVEEESYRIEKENVVNIKDSTTSVSLNMNNEKWTNEKQNEVTFDISLNSLSAANNLFNNPTFRIKLPNSVEKVILNNSSLMYTNSLAIKEAYVETLEDGTMSIVVNLSGNETLYNGNTLGLATDIKLSTSIILKNDIEANLGKVSVEYTNNYTLDGSVEQGTIEKTIAIEDFKTNQNNTIAQNEISSIENTNGVVSTVTQAVEEKVKAEILAATQDEIEGLEVNVTPTKGNIEIKDGDTIYEGDFIKYNITVTNTTSNDIDDVRIIASIPEGTKYGELETKFDSLENRAYQYNFDEELTEKEINIGTLKAGNTYTGYYEVQVEDLPEGESEKEILTNITSYIGDTQTNSYELNNTIKPGDAKVFLWSALEGSDGEWVYGVNLSIPEGQETTLTINLPEQIDVPQETIDEEQAFVYAYKSDYSTNMNPEESDELVGDIDFEYHFEGNKVIINTTESGTYIANIKIIDDSKIRDFATEGIAELTSYATAETAGVQYISNENRTIFEFKNVVVSMTSENEGEEVKYEEEINYDIKITTTATFNAKDQPGAINGVYVNILDYLPEYVNPVSVSYDYYEVEYETVQTEEGETKVATGFKDKETRTEDISFMRSDENGNRKANVDIYTWVPDGETIEVKINTTAGFVTERTEIENSAIIQSPQNESTDTQIFETGIETKTTNIIKHIIVPFDTSDESTPSDPSDPDDPNNPEEPDNPNNPEDPTIPSDGKYSISGISWNDENGDGTRQNDESLISGIEVMLVDMADSNNVKASTTTNNGRYTFSNIDRGNYIVVFRYNTQSYLLTTYKVNGASEDVNSDAIEETITLNGDRVNVGVTDNINLTQDEDNIDIGLIDRNGYDLKLDKYISNVSVTTKSGTKQYSYDNAKLGKVEIRAKEIEGAEVAVTYKIVITNEGKAKVKVSEVYDYLPEGLSFSSSNNTNWTSSGDMLVNKGLMNQEINPGESKEITLTLTKTMNSESVGTFTNAAEIGLVDTIEGINDADSTPGNRNQSEDDYSEAELIISVSTGLAVYISMGGIIILAIIVLLVLIIKYKINISKISKVGFSILVFTLACLMSSNYVAAAAPSRATYYWSGQHSFSGGPSGSGTCQNYGLVGAGRNNIGCYHGRGYSWQYDTSVTQIWGDIQTTSPHISLQKNNTNINVRKIGNNYILGPFQITTNSSGGSITILDKNNTRIDGWGLCNENGVGSNPLAGTGNVTFYLSLSESLYERGVSRVQLNQSRTASYSQTYDISGRSYYKSDVRYVSCTVRRKGGGTIRINGHQNVLSSYYHIGVGTNQWSENTSATVEWTSFNASLDIVKVDKDDVDIKIDIQGTLRKDDGTYNQSFSTSNGEYHFDNLTPGKYVLTETVNNEYGYEEEVNKTLDILVYSGLKQKVLITNEKHTGILKITKNDPDSNTNLENVGFRIMDSSGQYIVGIDTNGERLTEAIGDVYFGNMETTSNIEEATEFKTDSNGEIRIYNIRVGTYTVQEVSIGDNNYGYEIDDDFISWDNGQESGTGAIATIEVVRQRSYETMPETDVIYDNQKTIEDGTYQIETGVSSNFAIELAKSYTYNSANVAIYTKSNSIGQQWYVRYLGNGYYTIMSLAAQKYMDVYNGNAIVQNGTNVQIYPANGATNQQWKFVSKGNGYYSILTRANEAYALDVNAAAAANNTNIQMYQINGSAAQNFKFNDLADVYEVSESTVNFHNRRKFVKLSGKVWEDMISGKTSQRDYKYSETEEDESNPDKLVANVTVKLKDRDGNSVDFKTEDGRIVNEILTDENGSYKMVDVLIDELPNYYIEFSYNGMSYTSIPIVDLVLSNDDYNGTRAIENADERTEFNNNYSTITHQGVTDPIGESLDETGEKTYDLNYDEDTENHQSYLNYGEGSVYGYENQKFPINMTEEQYMITSNTRDAFISVEQGYSGYLSDIKSPETIRVSGITEVENINLGLQEREQPDLAVVEDIESAKITLNGYEHTYYYNQRFENQEVPGGFDVGVKFGNEYGSASYTRAIYSSDVVYNMQEGNEGKLGVYIRYKISLRNEATTLYSIANEAVNYFDNRYDIDSITDANGNILDYQLDENYNNNGFKKVTIQTNQNISAQQQNIIYITYKLQNDAVNAILNQDVTLDSITEITSYSTYSDENYTVHYGGVDRDSRPGSVIPENRNNTSDDDNKNTYEDDTDSAPSLILQISESEGRVIRGTVWEDNAIEELLENEGYDKERKGDGIYVEGENVVSQVKVELLSCDENGNPQGVASLYKKDDVTGEDVEVPESAITNTDENGNYEIAGIIPGKYVIRYTYGNSSIIVRTDGTTENIDPEKYKSTVYRGGNKEQAEAMTDYWYRAETGENVTRYSDALDTSGIRADGTRIDDLIEYRTREREDGTYTEEKSYTYGTVSKEENPDLTDIESNTRMFDIKIDYDINLDNISRYGEELKFIFDNIDLGIIRRPVQNIDVRKEISYIQVKLANGQVIIDGDPRNESLDHVRFLPDGNVHIEIDSELLQGSTLTIRYEIVVDNTKAEIDYDNRDYYIYGNVPDGNENWKIATISNLIDYLSNEVIYDEDNTENTSNWQQITNVEQTDLVEQGLLSEEAFEAVKKYNLILQTSEFEDMQPNEEKRVPLVVSRVLSNTDDDLVYENDIEINEVTNRRMEHNGEYTTPGDYVPSDTGREPGGDDDYIYLTVSKPTGEDKNYIPYIILGISSCVILGAGIVFIKKKVL